MTGPALGILGERVDCLIYGAESTGRPYRNQRETSPTCTLQRINANGTKRSNEKHKISKLSEEYLRMCLYNIEIVKDILRCKSTG